MPKYKIGIDMGYVGTSDEDIIEAASLEEAEESAWAWACENISHWAEEIEEGEYKIGIDVGYGVASDEDIIEADSLEDAEKQAWEWACDQISRWAEPLGEEDDE